MSRSRWKRTAGTRRPLPTREKQSITVAVVYTRVT